MDLLSFAFGVILLVVVSLDILHYDWRRRARELAQLSSSLRASPYALSYSSPAPELRLPGALERFARRAAETEAGPFHSYRGLLGQLPSLGASSDPPESDAAFLGRLTRWARRYSFA